MVNVKLVTTNDRLIFKRQLKNGRILAVNVWQTGVQELVYQNMESFNRAKIEIETNNAVPIINGNHVEE